MYISKITWSLMSLFTFFPSTSIEYKYVSLISNSETAVAFGNSTASTIFYEADNATTISTTTTLSRASSNPGKIYTKFQEVVVGTAPGTVELIVADGEEFIIDAYQLGVV